MVMEEAIKKKVIEQQQRNTRASSPAGRTGYSVRANNNHSGRSPPVRFGAATSFSFAPLVDLRSGRCIATRIDLSLYPVGP